MNRTILCRTSVSNAKQDQKTPKEPNQPDSKNQDQPTLAKQQIRKISNLRVRNDHTTNYDYEANQSPTNCQKPTNTLNPTTREHNTSQAQRKPSESTKIINEAKTVHMRDYHNTNRCANQ